MTQTEEPEPPEPLRAEHLDFFTGRLKLRHLVVALTVAEHGSAVAAASALYVSQPAITRLIHELERTLGVRLFDRTPHGMVPTEYAQPFLQHATAAIAHIRQASQHISELENAERGVVTVGFHLAGAALLQQAVVNLKREHPKVKIELIEGLPADLRSRLATGGLDLMVSRLNSLLRPDPEPGEALSHEALFTDPLHVVCSRDHPLADVQPLALSDLADQPWVLPLRGMALRDELETAFVAAGVALPENVVETTSVGTIQRLATEGRFLAVIPAQAAATLPGITVLDVTDCRMRGTVGVAWAADHVPSPATALMLRHIREQAKVAGEAAGAPGAPPR